MRLCVAANEPFAQVRPAYMDEYELLEVELSDLFRSYLEKHRNLDYLQSQLDSHTQREKQRMDENERKMREIQRKIRCGVLCMCCACVVSG